MTDKELENVGRARWLEQHRTRFAVLLVGATGLLCGGLVIMAGASPWLVLGMVVGLFLIVSGCYLELIYYPECRAGKQFLMESKKEEEA